MSRSDIADPTLAESADLLQRQIIYNGDILDIALDSLRAYRQGSQSLAYLNASVHLAYALMRILERWTKDKGDGVYVRKKAARRRRKAKGMDYAMERWTCTNPKPQASRKKMVFQMPKRRTNLRGTKIPFKKPSLPSMRLKW